MGVLGFYFKVNVYPDWFNVEQRALQKAKKYKIKVGKPEDLAPKIHDLVFDGSYRYDLTSGNIQYNIIHNLIPHSDFNEHMGNPLSQTISMGHYSFGPYVSFGLKNEDCITYYDQCNKYIKDFTISPHRFLGLTYNSGTLGLGYTYFKNGGTAHHDADLNELHNSFEKISHFPLQEVMLWLAKIATNDIEMPEQKTQLDPKSKKVPEKIEYRSHINALDFKFFQYSYNVTTKDGITELKGKPGITISEFIDDYVTYRIFIKPIIS